MMNKKKHCTIYYTIISYVSLSLWVVDFLNFTSSVITKRYYSIICLINYSFMRGSVLVNGSYIILAQYTHHSALCILNAEENELQFI